MFDGRSLPEPAGAVKPVGRAAAALDLPLSLFIAGFIGPPPINMISGEARDGVMCAGSVAFPFEGAPGVMTVGLRPEHLRFTGSGLSGRVAQLEPMGREILYVVDTDAGCLRVLEHGSIAAHSVDEPVRIGFSPADSLVFDAASQRLLAAARVGPSA
jgi:inositol-phosphate transport system ATP-binding protein